MNWKFREPLFFGWGLRLGVRALAAARSAAHARQALAMVLQPINTYTRYPEYHCVESAIGAWLDLRTDAEPARILDVGSPKLMGLYLGQTRRCDLMLTDLSPTNLDPYGWLWDLLARRRAPGKVQFVQCDVRALGLPAESVDIVYSMSVVEHIEGADGDRLALREMLRVLRPGGLLVVTVPYGKPYLEQIIRGMQHASEYTGDQAEHFFQRIYDAASAEERLIGPLRADCATLQTVSIGRRIGRWLRAYHGFRAGVPLWMNSVTGWFNPILSRWFNIARDGLADDLVTVAGREHSYGDIYGDLVIVAVKRGRQAPGRAD